MIVGKGLSYTVGRFLRLPKVLVKADSMTQTVSTHHEAPTRCKLALMANRKLNKTRQRSTPSRNESQTATYKILTLLFNRTIINIVVKLLALRIKKIM